MLVLDGADECGDARKLVRVCRERGEDGFVLLRDFGEGPPRVEYELTLMGKERLTLAFATERR